MSERVKKLVDEAKSKGMWLYEPTYRHWYSPEEFWRIFEKYAKASDDLLDKMQIRHPIEGISAGMKKLQDTRDKLYYFTAAVMKYYGDLPK